MNTSIEFMSFDKAAQAASALIWANAATDESFEIIVHGDASIDGDPVFGSVAFRIVRHPLQKLTNCFYADVDGIDYHSSDVEFGDGAEFHLKVNIAS